MRIILALLLLVQAVSGATIYVRDGASGAANGANWTDAYDELSSAETAAARGDTIYVADGTYAAVTFNTAASGATVITVKKATVADHGTTTGWLDSYGDGQAVIGQCYFPSGGWWTFDGQVGGGPTSWESGHGFKFSVSAGTDPIWIVAGVHNIRFEHCEITANASSGPPYSTGFYAPSSSSNLYIGYCYLHDVPGDMMQTRGLTNFTVEYSKMARNFQDATRHGDLIENDSSGFNYIFRYNFVEDCVGTYLLGHHNTGILDGYKIYGNIFYWTTSFAGTLDNGMISTLTSGSGYITNMTVHQNTFWNGLNGQTGGGPANWSINPRLSACVVSNNIFHFKSGDSSTTTFTYGTGVEHGYNWHINRSVTGDNAINSSGDPFVDSASKNFQLLTNSIAGATLGSPFTADMLGTNFNTSGTWTRGSLAFSGAGGGSGSPTTGKALIGGRGVTFGGRVEIK